MKKILASILFIAGAAFAVPPTVQTVVNDSLVGHGFATLAAFHHVCTSSLGILTTAGCPDTGGGGTDSTYVRFVADSASKKNINDTAIAQGWSNTGGNRTLTLTQLLTGTTANFAGRVNTTVADVSEIDQAHGFRVANAAGKLATMEVTTGGANWQSWGAPMYLNPLGNNIFTNRDGGNFNIGTGSDLGYKLGINGTLGITGTLTGVAANFSGKLTAPAIVATDSLRSPLFNNGGTTATFGGNIIFKKSGFSTRGLYGSSDSATVSINGGTSSTPTHGASIYVDGSLSDGGVGVELGRTKNAQFYVAGYPGNVFTNYITADSLAVVVGRKLTALDSISALKVRAVRLQSTGGIDAVGNISGNGYFASGGDGAYYSFNADRGMHTITDPYGSYGLELFENNNSTLPGYMKLRANSGAKAGKIEIGGTAGTGAGYGDTVSINPFRQMPFYVNGPILQDSGTNYLDGIKSIEVDNSDGVAIWTGESGGAHLHNQSMFDFITDNGFATVGYTDTLFSSLLNFTPLNFNLLLNQSVLDTMYPNDGIIKIPILVNGESGTQRWGNSVGVFDGDGAIPDTTWVKNKITTDQYNFSVPASGAVDADTIPNLLRYTTFVDTLNNDAGHFELPSMSLWPAGKPLTIKVFLQTSDYALTVDVAEDGDEIDEYSTSSPTYQLPKEHSFIFGLTTLTNRIYAITLSHGANRDWHIISNATEEQ